jgi:type VI secretion system Hcp family effector
MSTEAYLFLKLNGTDVHGDTTLSSIAGVDVSRAIELAECSWGVALEAGESNRRGAGHRRHEPFRALKRVDRTTPLLLQGLTQNQQVDAVVRVFRPDAETGEIHNHLTIELQRGRLTRLAGLLPDPVDVAGPARTMTERLEIVYHTIVVRHELSGAEASDSWDQIA